MENKIVYRIKHIGINTDGEQPARQLTEQLCSVFGQQRGAETPAGIFAGEIFEVMKNRKRGVNGHIALQTDDVEAAMEELAQKGITFQEDTIRRNEQGRIRFVYLQQEFGGFSFHLTE